MSEFDEHKAYQSKEGNKFFDDGREVELLHYVYERAADVRGSPEKVLNAIDDYGRTKKYLMNVGEDKGKIVTDLIREKRPEYMLELGGYCGYSALKFGDAVKKAGGKRYFSLERNAEFGAVIMALADLAGLSDTVRVVIGSSAHSIQRLHQEGYLPRIDLMFLDHYKPAYTTDLKLCESLGLISPGSVLAADNVISPGNPPYLEYVRSSVQEKRARLSNPSGHSDTLAQFANRTRNQYSDKDELGDSPGNPNLVYKSVLVNSFEPTGEPDGVEVTRCIGVDEDNV